MYENLEAQDLHTYYISEFRNFQLQAPENSKNYMAFGSKSRDF